MDRLAGIFSGPKVAEPASPSTPSIARGMKRVTSLFQSLAPPSFPSFGRKVLLAEVLESGVSPAEEGSTPALTPSLEGSFLSTSPSSVPVSLEPKRQFTIRDPFTTDLGEARKQFIQDVDRSSLFIDTGSDIPTKVETIEKFDEIVGGCSEIITQQACLYWACSQAMHGKLLEVLLADLQTHTKETVMVGKEGFMEVTVAISADRIHITNSFTAKIRYLVNEEPQDIGTRATVTATMDIPVAKTDAGSHRVVADINIIS